MTNLLWGSLVDVIKRKPVLTVEEIRNSYFISLDEAPFPLETVSVHSSGKFKA